MPICNYEGEVIGVAQIINKTNGTQEFTTRDVEVSLDHQSIRNGGKQKLRNSFKSPSDFTFMSNEVFSVICIYSGVC
jgi:hypothetical protein